MFVNYFSDLSIIQPLNNNRTRTIWIDSCRIHNESLELVEALQLSRTELKRFEPNCTSTAQPLDQLGLRAFKAEWRKRWEEKRNELVQASEYTSTGRIYNPGKHLFLKLVMQVVDELNSRISVTLPLQENPWLSATWFLLRVGCGSKNSWLCNWETSHSQTRHTLMIKILVPESNYKKMNKKAQIITFCSKFHGSNDHEFIIKVKLPLIFYSRNFFIRTWVEAILHCLYGVFTL